MTERPKKPSSKETIGVDTALPDVSVLPVRVDTAALDVSVSPIRVDTEIGCLQTVMVHRPGDELVHMTQDDLERLLFDDILSPESALAEHDLMVEIIAGSGAQVLELKELLETALRRAPDAARSELLATVCRLAGVTELADKLSGWRAERLAQALICGLRWREAPDAPRSLVRIERELEQPQPSALQPLPNLMFMRDPCFCVGDQVVVGRMATEARRREPFLVAFALEHGGALASPRLCMQREHAPAMCSASVEGGDVLVISPEVVLVGCSERTTAQGIERMAREGLFPASKTLQRIYAVMMPARRSVMHLDTVLTHVDRKLFLGYLPMIAGSDGDGLSVVRLSRDGAPELLAGATVLDVLKEELGADVDLVPCGGHNPLHQQREQWTDGANAFAVAPGHVILYARNVHTVAALVRHDFAEVAVHMLQPPDERQAIIAEGMQQPRAIFSFPGSELSRARGGGRCLTMPLQRRPL